MPGLKPKQEKLNGETSGKWIMEGDKIILLDNSFNKVGDFEMAYGSF